MRASPARLILGWLSLILTVGLATNAFGQRQPSDLTELPLEALMNLEVTSVSKRPQRLADSATAIFVLTQDDIRRSGATSIPEALRLVPGLHVARVDSNVWVVNARGFSSRFSTKFLVLLDGRAVYTPEFAGVFWDVQDTVLEDIERIEVIRGPGAALWGANAVNGVINIVTKRARDTQGGLLALGAGTEERGFGTLRYGAKVGDAAFKAYVKYFNRDEAVLKGPGDRGAGDAWELLRGGFRLDLDLSERDTFTIQGDGYGGTVSETFATPILFAPFVRNDQVEQPLNGFNILGRWQRTFSEVSGLQLQTYYDRTRRDDLKVTVDLDTFDVDFQYRLPLGTRNDFVWGPGYRYYHFEGRPARVGFFSPSDRDLHLFSGFAQNDTTIIPKTLHLILGTKLEHNTFTGWEWQPTGRLLWTPNPDHTVWGAVSRAVRTPSLVERQGHFNLAVSPPVSPFVPLPTLAQIVGNSSFGSEKLLAYEIGYRTRLSPRLSFDVAAFYNIYDDLQFSEISGLPSLEFTPVPHLLLRNNIKNGLEGETYGIEVVSDIELQKWWRLRPAYSYLEVRTRRKPGIVSFADPHLDEGSSPQHQGYLKSSIDVWKNIELDLIPRYLSPLPKLKVDGYAELDARLAWWPIKSLELSLVGRNLVHSRHSEFNSPFGGPVPIKLKREVYGKLTLRF